MITVVDAKKWRPLADSGTVPCPHCAADWGDNGRDLIALFDALEAIHAKVRAGGGPAGGSRVPPAPAVIIQAEIAEQNR